MPKLESQWPHLLSVDLTPLECSGLHRNGSNINEATDNLFYCQVIEAELSKTDLIKNS